MTKEEFLGLAPQKWGAINAHKEESQNLYEYEKGLDQLWAGFGRTTLEGSIGEVPENHRKKKSLGRYGMIEIAHSQAWSLQGKY